MNDVIEIRNARTHNLKDLSCDIPRHQFVVFTGVSGSGKSSLLFHTVHTEAQRQLVETFSTFAQQRLPKLSRPPVDEIRNISTPIVIDQKALGKTMRSTVGTATEVATYLRLLFSRQGSPSIGPSFYFSFNNPEGMCPGCNGLGYRISVNPDMLVDEGTTLLDGAITHPEYKVGGYFWKELIQSGLFQNDLPVREFTEPQREQLLYSPKISVRRTLEGKEITLRFEGVHTKLQRIFATREEQEAKDSEKNAYQRYLTHATCDQCSGSRVNERARGVTLGGLSITQVCDMELAHLARWLKGLENEANRPLVRKMTSILGYLITIGVGYLSLNRPVATLSGGESQRLKMARQLDCDLIDLMYIFDEPSIGLHPRDTETLVKLLRQLRDKGNSVLVVEHDPDIIRSADYLIDIGPRAGSHGGELVFAGAPGDIDPGVSATGACLFEPPTHRTELRTPTGWFEVTHASRHNLKDLNVRIPEGVFCCLTGVAGSGKSTLLHDVFVPAHPEAVVVDQSPVGRSRRSNPLTYLGVFDRIRKLFAKATGLPASRFSFNSSGACPTCKGLGTVSIELSFMDPILMTCDQCSGRRYTQEVLDHRMNDLSIHDLLVTTAEDAIRLFEDPAILRPLEMMCTVGLGYLELGQPLSTLSGGECQRLKLSSELHKKGSIYILDEPTTGLHGADIAVLLGVIQQLADNNNSVLVIEHNIDVILQADWVIDLGPEGGNDGGQLVAEGPPRDLTRDPVSHTGRYLAERIGAGPGGSDSARESDGASPGN